MSFGLLTAKPATALSAAKPVIRQSQLKTKINLSVIGNLYSLSRCSSILSFVLVLKMSVNFRIADTQAQVYVSWNNRLVTSSSESLESAIDGDDNRKTLSFHSANYRNVHVMDVDGAVTHTEVLPISMSPHRLPSDTSTPPRHLLAKVEAEDKTFLNLSCDPLESLVISLSYTDLPVHQLHTDRRTIPIESLGSRSNCTD